MDDYSAYFYTLVSLDTEEVKYADQRQQHLVDQGFYFEVIQELPFMKQQDRKTNLIMSTDKDQSWLLDQILKNKEKIEKTEGIEKMDELEKDEDQKALNAQNKKNKSRMLKE